MKPFRPLLAPREDPLSYPAFFDELVFPMLASPKIDGIRGVCKNFTMMSRSFKEIPSEQVQLELTSFEDSDGEIVEGSPLTQDTFNRTQSHVMSANKPGDLSYYVFDLTEPLLLDKPFYRRLEAAKAMLPPFPEYKFVEHEFVDSVEDLLLYEENQLTLGYEGLMLRNPEAYYKQGRGTWKENIIRKLKRFVDAEGLLVGVLEGFTNNNIATTDALGFTERSHHKENKTTNGRVGKFLVQYGEQVITVAPGAFTHAELKEIWEARDFYITTPNYISFRYMAVGMKDAPRFARAKGFRSAIDIT